MTCGLLLGSRKGQSGIGHGIVGFGVVEVRVVVDCLLVVGIFKSDKDSLLLSFSFSFLMISLLTSFLLALPYIRLSLSRRGVGDLVWLVGWHLCGWRLRRR